MDLRNIQEVLKSLGDTDTVYDAAGSHRNELKTSEGAPLIMKDGDRVAKETIERQHPIPVAGFDGSPAAEAQSLPRKLESLSRVNKSQSSFGSNEGQCLLTVSNANKDIARQLAIKQCLRSISGGGEKTWQAYPGHTKLSTLDMTLDFTEENSSRDTALKECSNSDIEPWLNQESGRYDPNLSTSSSFRPAKLKVLFVVVVVAGEDISSHAEDDVHALRKVFHR